MALPSSRGPDDVNQELASFGKAALRRIESIDVRLRVVDIADNTYERIIRCLHTAPEAYRIDYSLEANRTGRTL
jgi:hypothetical protein